MYDLYFYILIWIVLGVVAIPVVLVSVFIIVIGRINDTQRAEAMRLAKFKKIQFLLGIINAPDSSKEQLEEALEAFKKYHATFGALDPTSAEYNHRMEFISRIILTEIFNIDNASKFRDELVSRNRDYKREIEQTISQSLKNRESKDKTKGNK